MKKIIMAFAVSSLFFTCKSKAKTELDTNKNIVLPDTSALHKGSILSDTGSSKAAVTTSSTTTTTTTTTSTTGNPNIKKVARKKSIAKNASQSNNNTSTANAGTPQDKGWSDAAKGRAIGAGSGAILGAVVSKNKGKGAIIGAVLGAGTGYAVGRSRDKKSGRVARKRKSKVN